MDRVSSATAAGTVPSSLVRRQGRARISGLIVMATL